MTVDQWKNISKLKSYDKGRLDQNNSQVAKRLEEISSQYLLTETPNKH